MIDDILALLPYQASRNAKAWGPSPRQVVSQQLTTRYSLIHDRHIPRARIVRSSNSDVDVTKPKPSGTQKLGTLGRLCEATYELYESKKRRRNGRAKTAAVDLFVGAPAVDFTSSGVTRDASWGSGDPLQSLGHPSTYWRRQILLAAKKPARPCREGWFPHPTRSSLEPVKRFNPCRVEKKPSKV